MSVGRICTAIPLCSRAPLGHAPPLATCLKTYFAVFTGDHTLPAFADFDWQAYLDYNPDVRRFGVNTQELAAGHYATYGYREGRVSGCLEGWGQSAKAPCLLSGLFTRVYPAVACIRCQCTPLQHRAPAPFIPSELQAGLHTLRIASGTSHPQNYKRIPLVVRYTACGGLFDQRPTDATTPTPRPYVPP